MHVCKFQPYRSPQKLNFLNLMHFFLQEPESLLLLKFIISYFFRVVPVFVNQTCKSKREVCLRIHTCLV